MCSAISRHSTGQSMLDTHQVITSRYPQVAKNKLLNKPVSAVVKHLLCEQEINDFEKTYPHLSGFDYVEQVLRHFDFSFRIKDQQRERIPSTGKVVIIANHPIGSLDGLALIKCIQEVRDDVKVIANDMLMAIEPLHEILLPVNNMQGNTPKQNLHNIHLHLQNEGALIVFPAGEVSRLRPQGVRDTKWHNGFIRFAKRAQCPILPICIDAKNSALFYGVSMLYKPAATALLVKEMFNKKNKSMDVHIGELIPYEGFAHLNIHMKEQVKLFKKHLYRLRSKKSPVMPTQSAIALPENRKTLHEALKTQCELLGTTSDGKLIYLYRYQTSSPIMRELGRLRELTFRAVGEGTNQRRDVDQYDKTYFHLILWDPNDLEIAGAYRFGDAKRLVQQTPSIYSATLFDYSPSMTPYFEQGLELGRSFVQEKYWGKRSLDYLWMGIGAFLKRYPEYRYLFGPVTLSAQLPKKATDLIVSFYLRYFPDHDNIAHAKIPYRSAESNAEDFDGLSYKEAMPVLKTKLANMNVAIPTLYKQYADLCDEEGVRFTAFNIDPDFQNCIDGLVMVDIHKLSAKKRKRYLA